MVVKILIILTFQYRSTKQFLFYYFEYYKYRTSVTLSEIFSYKRCLKINIVDNLLEISRKYGRWVFLNECNKRILNL